MLTIPTLTLALLIAAPAQAPDMTRREFNMKAPLIVFAVAASADWITTHRQLSNGGHEYNPALSWIGDKPNTVVAVGAAFDVVGAWAVQKYIGRKRPKLAAALLYGAAATRVFFAVRNENRLQRGY